MHALSRANRACAPILRRYVSLDARREGKRFIRTAVPSVGGKLGDFYSSMKMGNEGTGMKWAKHSLAVPIPREDLGKNDGPGAGAGTGSPFSFASIEIPESEGHRSVKNTRRSRFAKAEKPEAKETKLDAKDDSIIATVEEPAQHIAKTSATASTEPITAATTTTSAPAAEPQVKPKKRRVLKPRKALISLSPNAVLHLKDLLNQPEPKLIRIGVRNRGCSGLTYHLEYVTEPAKFDELIEQDGVKVFIDSKALFSIVGSEMDWLDDKLSSRFIFKNPNSKGTCGCGESFMV